MKYSGSWSEFIILIIEASVRMYTKFLDERLSLWEFVFEQ